MRDQEIRGRLVHALRECGITTNPQKLADAICALVNQKVEKSEGRHHSKFHRTAGYERAPHWFDGNTNDGFNDGDDSL